MSAELNQVAAALFEKIRSRFDDVSVGDEKAKSTQDPDNARFFNFDYVDREGNNFGNVTVSLIDENSLKVYFGKNLSANLDEAQKAEWYDFLRDLRMFSKRNLLSFDTRDISRSTLHIKDIKQAATADSTFSADDVNMNEGRLTGTTKTSYDKITPTTRLVIKHDGHIDDSKHGARTRRIHAVYVEDSEGQRLKCPFNNLAGCRALARHIASGGQINDEFGSHIAELVDETAKIRRFVSGSRNKTFEDGEATEIAQDAKDRYRQIQRTLHSLKGPRGYGMYKESWKPSEVTDEDIDLDEIRAKFVQKNFDERLEDGLPFAYRAHKQAKAAKQMNEFEDWANQVTEGTWAVPDNDLSMKELQELMAEPLTAGIDGENATAALYDIIGNDTLFDRIYDASKGSPDMDVRPVIYDWLQSNMPSVFDQVKGNMEAGDVGTEEQPIEPAPEEPQEAPQEQPQESADPIYAMRRLAGLSKIDK